MAVDVVAGLALPSSAWPSLAEPDLNWPMGGSGYGSLVAMVWLKLVVTVAVPVAGHGCDCRCACGSRGSWLWLTVAVAMSRTSKNQH